MLIAIAAMTPNHVIGNNNTIPRHLPDDQKLFKELTFGHTVVMGRKTYDSLPLAVRPLP
jgi:dihydrofolate reductase